MCGIFGLISKKKLDRINLDLKLSKVLEHRGPDSWNSFISKDKKRYLFQSRLSIIDLDKSATPPFKTDRSIIVFNGEIYNYKELKEELISKGVKFNTKSDTEVLQKGYEQFGIDILYKIKGMYSFAIYDLEKNFIFLANDPLAQKPLLYCHNENDFIFGSEIPSIVKTTSEKLSISKEGLALFLTPSLTYIPPPYTIFKEIKKNKPGNYLIYDLNLNKLEINKIKKFKIKEKELEKHLRDYIGLMIPPKDVKFASMLSGGIDSTLVTLLSGSKNSYVIKCSEEEDRDIINARKIANLFNINLIELSLDYHSLLKIQERIIKNYGEPYFHITTIFSEIITKKAREDGFKVLFSGAGGDELFYGYNNLNLLLFSVFFKLKCFKFGKNIYLNSDTKTYRKNKLINELKNSVKIIRGDINLSNVANNVLPVQEDKLYIHNSYKNGLFFENLHSLTIGSDIAGMDNSVEIRTPFLESEVYMESLNYDLFEKIGLFFNGKKKLKDVLLKLIPKEIVYRKKLGFGSDSNFNKIIELNSLRIKEGLIKLRGYNIVDVDYINAVIDSISENPNLNEVMKLYSIFLWLKENRMD